MGLIKPKVFFLGFLEGHKAQHDLYAGRKNPKQQIGRIKTLEQMSVANTDTAALCVMQLTTDKCVFQETNYKF